MGEYIANVSVGVKKQKVPYKTEVVVKDANKKSKAASTGKIDNTSLAENIANQLQKSYKR